MPRRVFTYPDDIGWDWFNLISTIGACGLGIGMFAVVADVTLPVATAVRGEVNPWRAGTLEWTSDPEENLGHALVSRSSRAAIRSGTSPTWRGGRKPALLSGRREGRAARDVGDLRAGRRADPVLRVGGTSYVTIVAAVRSAASSSHLPSNGGFCRSYPDSASSQPSSTGSGPAPAIPESDGEGHRAASACRSMHPA
jgi:cytochrome c oxidase subunit I+III